MTLRRGSVNAYLVPLLWCIAHISGEGTSPSTASVILEPVPSMSGDDSTLSSTTPLRVINTDADGAGNAFSLNLRTNNRIEFVLQPPSNAGEISLSTGNPDDSIEVTVRASVIEGSIKDNCTDVNNSDGGRSQLLAGGLLEASVVGSDADPLSAAYQWERSYITIEEHGCAIESRLYFQPLVDGSSNASDTIFEASIERLTWSAEYDPALIGGDGTEAFTYQLQASSNGTEGAHGAAIQGASLEMIEEGEDISTEQAKPPPSPPNDDSSCGTSLRVLLSVLAVDVVCSFSIILL
mmetsp:Transcript_2872/g.6646  ORF Transcript_2872/g.6646 Transcript_2872/m.6646 type:complete len:294 (+) Transcript_2872:57-938(+)